MATQMHVAFSSLFMGVGMIGGSKYAQLSFIINHFSGPVRAVVPLCVSVCSGNNFRTKWSLH